MFENKRLRRYNSAYKGHRKLTNDYTGFYY